MSLKSVSMAVPSASAASANDAFQALGFGPGTFSVALTEGMLGAHSYSDEVAALLEAGAAGLGDVQFKIVDGGAAPQTFFDFIAEHGWAMAAGDDA